MMKASVWLAAISKCRPDIFMACLTAWEQGSIDGEFVRVNKNTFEQCPSDSIDYAVMERITDSGSELPDGVVIPLTAKWSDIGAWNSLWQVLPKDNEGNVTKGDVLLNDCKNTLAISDSRLVTCIGTEDLIVVKTPDAVLIVNKKQDTRCKINRRCTETTRQIGKPVVQLE